MSKATTLDDRNDNRPVHIKRPPRVLVPILPDCDNDDLLRLAGWLAESQPVLLVGIVPVPEGTSLSAGAARARELRQMINRHINRVTLRAKSRIRVSHTPWEELQASLARESSIQLLILNWPCHFEMMRLSAAEILSRPPCDVAVVHGPFPEQPGRILVPMRGGPHAERSLSLALALSEPTGATVATLQARTAQDGAEFDQAFAGIAQVLAALPEVEQLVEEADVGAEAIRKHARPDDIIILGTAARPTEVTHSFGRITDALLADSPNGVISVKTRRAVFPHEGSRFAYEAISVLVDRWFAENTFHSDEFADLDRLVALKEEQGLTISLALPALNEAETIGPIIRQVQQALVEERPLLDEIVLVDSNSTDDTREIAADLGIPVFIHQEVLPQYGARHGKGEALWKSLYLTRGDLIVWVDTDVKNFDPSFVYGLIGPFLLRQELMFVKGFYRRPLRTDGTLHPGRGGRVTELTARPLLNLFYPELSGIIQPLAGEYAGRRAALEQVPFASGYGVETGLLIDILERHKLGAIGQVNLEERIHRNQSLTRLSQMSFAIIQTLVGKLERRYGVEMLRDINRTMKMVHYEPGEFYLTVHEIAELERPPMVAVPEYRARFNRPALEAQSEAAEAPSA